MMMKKKAIKFDEDLNVKIKYEITKILLNSLHVFDAL